MKKIKILIYQWINTHFLDGCSSYNSLSVRKRCRTKKQARDMFAEHDFPHARGTTFINPLKAVRFVKKHGFPVVIKPDVSGFSRGSHFPVTNTKQLWKAIFFARFWWPVSVIEEYLKGRNYRVVIANDQIMAVIERYSPFVIGDGNSSINKLVEIENTTRETMGLYPEMHPIEMNHKVIRYLKKQGLNDNSIPADGERIELFNKIALAPGGIVETVNIDAIHPDNKKLFLRFLDLFRANILGVDIIMKKGIDASWKDQACILLEVNSRPYLKMHAKPRYGEIPDLSTHFHQLEQKSIDDPDIF